MGEIRGSKWQMTVQLPQWPLLERMPHFVYKWGWQEEISPTTGTHHKQGWIQTRGTLRIAQLKKALPGVHIELARNWQACLAYSQKKDTAVAGTFVEQENTSMGKIEFTTFLLERIHETIEWKDLTIDDIYSHVNRLGNEHILETGDVSLAFILSDPNFKITVRNSGRAILYSFRTDGRTA